MTSPTLQSLGGRIIVFAKPHTLSAQLRELAVLADPRQDVDASAPHYTRGLSKQVQS